MRDGRDTAGISHHGRRRRGGQNGLDGALVYSPDVSADHPSHKLPAPKCSFPGCLSRLAWQKIQRIMREEENPEDWYCYSHKGKTKMS